MNSNAMVAIHGRLVRAEVKVGRSGKPFTVFSVAVDQATEEGAPPERRSFFVDAVAFGKSGEGVGRSAPGSPVFLTGHLVQDQWQDQQGQKRTKFKVICSAVRAALDEPRNVEETGAASSARASEPAPPPEQPADYPF